MTINKDSTPTKACGDVKRVKCANSNLFTNLSIKKPEDVIVCESQEGNYCGRHVLRALTQRLDLFSDCDLKEIGNSLAAAEQACRHGERIDITDYYYEGSGDYDIQIIKAALLNAFNVDLIQIRIIQENNYSVQSLIHSNLVNSQALLVREDCHYYCLRRFRLAKEYFFKIDSKQSTRHEQIRRDDILKFVTTLLNAGSNVFVLIQTAVDRADEELSANNIENRLWALPDTPADVETMGQVAEMTNDNELRP